jgi:hypothetical protein
MCFISAQGGVRRELEDLRKESEEKEEEPQNMPEMVLPGVYIEVRAEGLIAPGRVTVGNIGIVGTASKGKVGESTLLGSYTEALQTFGPYDAIEVGKNELTLVRSLELAYSGGATTVYAVRVEAKAAPAAAATFKVAGEGAAPNVCAHLKGKTPGTWGNELSINVWDADANAGALIENEAVPVTNPATPFNLSRTPLSVNRVRVERVATGAVQFFTPVTTAPNSGQVKIDTKTLTFFAGEEPVKSAAGDGDKLFVTYALGADKSRKVTIKYRETSEIYTVADGKHLHDLVAVSVLVEPNNTGLDNPALLPAKSASAFEFTLFGKAGNTPGTDGASAADTDYATGLDLLTKEPVHLVVAAGQGWKDVGNELASHVNNASTDLMKGERIAIVGTGKSENIVKDGHTLASDRIVLVAPGIKVTDSAATPPKEVNLPGAYSAAVIAGMLSALDAHISLTNKPVPVGDLDIRWLADKLKRLVEDRVLVIEARAGSGIRVVKGITTDDGAFRQITTRRIVDFARYAVRSASQPYIGRLNNERVRAALQATVTSALQEMLDNEMLTAYTVEVTATRADEIKGIANVTIGLQPTFSIDFIKVTMILS